jgi:hypothetical protein
LGETQGSLIEPWPMRIFLSLAIPDVPMQWQGHGGEGLWSLPRIIVPEYKTISSFFQTSRGHRENPSPDSFFFLFFDSHGYQLGPHRGIFSISNRKCHIVAPPSRDGIKRYPLKLPEICFSQLGIIEKPLKQGI